MELLKLTDYNRMASMGGEYYDLKNIYPNWSFDLHEKGNFIENNKLKIISEHGLIKWYFLKISIFDIDYNYNQLNSFINNPHTVSFYDLKAILKLGKYFNIQNKYLSKLKLDKYNFKYQYFYKNYSYGAYLTNLNQENKDKVNKYSASPFGRYIIDNMGIDVFKNYLVNIYTEYLKYKEFFNNKSLFNNFIKIYPKIIDWGVVYHKFKIILEKMIKNNHKDIYLIDRFVDTVQRYIYTLIVKYIENMLLNQICDIYIKEEEKIYNNKYFQSYPDNILSKFDFTTII